MIQTRTLITKGKHATPAEPQTGEVTTYRTSQLTIKHPQRLYFQTMDNCQKMLSMVPGWFLSYESKPCQHFGQDFNFDVRLLIPWDVQRGVELGI